MRESFHEHFTGNIRYTIELKESMEEAQQFGIKIVRKFYYNDRGFFLRRKNGKK